MFALIWIAVAVLSLVDLQSHQQLFMNLAVFDQSARVNWTEAVLRTGVPPANPMYLYKHQASMRYYYFWNVLCAVISKTARLPVRAVFVASCVWVGFILAALCGLYLKHFLGAGKRLRITFLRTIALLAVTGIGASLDLLSLLGLKGAQIEGPAEDRVPSWLVSFFFVPHHVASMLCCMLAFLLAWMAAKSPAPQRAASLILIALSLASAFGLSIYVSFAFFLVMLVWAIWQVLIERSSHAAFLLMASGVAAIVLLLPYLSELTQDKSKMQGGALFSFSVREIILPDSLMTSGIFHHLAIGHPLLTLNLAKLILLIPGYALELGFYFAILLICLIPSWHGRALLTSEQRSLVFIGVTTIPLISLVRSGVLDINDFGVRGALPMQFALLLLASDVTSRWSDARTAPVDSDNAKCPQFQVPSWLRSLASLALILGVVGFAYQAFMLRFFLPIAGTAHDLSANISVNNLSHDAYISAIGYMQLDKSIPRDAITQFNPVVRESFLWTSVDLLGIDRQAAISSDQPWCGAEFGGDPSGCAPMAAAIDAVYGGTSAERALAVCQRYGIQYLVARVYDPAWKDKSGWVWTLPPVVQDPEFRAVDCRQ